MQPKYLHLIPYSDALILMEKLHAEIAQDPDKSGYLLVLQHPPTVTMGKRELIADMKITPQELMFKGISYHKIDRGGSVTVHEPGQVVIYPIICLEKYNLTVRSYVQALEQAMLDTCAHYQVNAARDSINPGVWVGQNKIGAVGIRVARKVTKHGLAFNITNSLDTFNHIVPCGLHGRGVTRLLSEVPSALSQSVQSDVFYQDVESFLVQKCLDYLI